MGEYRCTFLHFFLVCFFLHFFLPSRWDAFDLYSIQHVHLTSCGYVWTLMEGRYTHEKDCLSWGYVEALCKVDAPMRKHWLFKDWPNPKISASVVGTSNDEEDRNHLHGITHLSPKLPLCGSTSLIWPLSIPSLLGDALECVSHAFIGLYRQSVKNCKIFVVLHKNDIPPF
jgi:hypothetical protein